jgi:hypothetical protein
MTSKYNGTRGGISVRAGAENTPHLSRHDPFRIITEAGNGNEKISWSFWFQDRWKHVRILREQKQDEHYLVMRR